MTCINLMTNGYIIIVCKVWVIWLLDFNKVIFQILLVLLLKRHLWQASMAFKILEPCVDLTSVVFSLSIFSFKTLFFFLSWFILLHAFFSKILFSKSKHAWLIFKELYLDPNILYSSYNILKASCSFASFFESFRIVLLLMQYPSQLHHHIQHNAQFWMPIFSLAYLLVLAFLWLSHVSSMIRWVHPMKVWWYP